MINLSLAQGPFFSLNVGQCSVCVYVMCSAALPLHCKQALSVAGSQDCTYGGVHHTDPFILCC